MIHLKDVKALDEYIQMLQQFRKDYDKELTELTARKPLHAGEDQL